MNTYSKKIPDELTWLAFYLPHKQVSPVTLAVDWTLLLLFQLTVTNIHNFDSETQLLSIYNDQIGTINQLSNHHELENHVHGKICAVHFMRIHACAQASFAFYFSIEETEWRLFTFRISAMVPKLTGQNETTRAN